MKWEYLSLNIGPKDDLMATLDVCGRQGWELVSNWDNRFIFKRPIQPEPDVRTWKDFGPK
jgi:hypothetical protein